MLLCSPSLLQVGKDGGKSLDLSSSLLLPAKQKILVLHHLEINWSSDCQRVGVGRVESWPLLGAGVLSAVPSASMSRPSLQLLGDLGRKTGGQFLGQ